MNDLTLYKLIYEIQNNYQQYKDLYEAYKYKPDENIMNEMQKLNTTLKQQINQYNSIDKEKKDETMINIDETNTEMLEIMNEIKTLNHNSNISVKEDDSYLNSISYYYIYTFYFIISIFFIIVLTYSVTNNNVFIESIILGLSGTIVLFYMYEYKFNVDFITNNILVDTIKNISNSIYIYINLI